MADYPVAKAGDVREGRTLRVEAGGHEILLCRCEGGLYAIDDVCTHDGGPLDQGELEGCRVVCPRHGATFDVTTGEALTLPAVVPVRTYAVRVQGDDVIIDV
jgi:3-phenylpropionate/trans-cinnamate dioxygenase ferredoxin subunit